MPFTAPYPLMSDVLNITRTRINDMIVSAGGQTLTNMASFTLPMANVAWQQLQQTLVSLGYSPLEDEIIITGLQPVASLDPGIFVQLSWTGYNDGVNNHATIVLPQSLIRPLELWERRNAPVNTAVFEPVDEILDGIAAVPKGQWQQQWEWRANAIYMPGSIVPTDIRIRFAKYLADFTNLNTDVAPIMRCTDALAKFIAVEFATGRGDMDRATMLAEAQEAAGILAGMDTLEGRSLRKTSELGKMRDRYSAPQGGQAA